MKTIETKGGMIFEIWESRKEALNDIDMLDMDLEYYDWSDDALYIEYKDGSHFYIGSGEIEGKLKRNNIKAIVYSNPATTCLFGDYRIYNIDNTDETFTEEADSEEIFWNADVA